MNIVELLFGVLFSAMALWGLISGEVYVLAGKASAGDGGWASFDNHPVIFLLVFSIYLLCGIGLTWDGLKGGQ